MSKIYENVRKSTKIYENRRKSIQKTVKIQKRYKNCLGKKSTPSFMKVHEIRQFEQF